jgi:uncharacterized protein (DUF1501 family)
MDECTIVQFYLRGGADGMTLCVPCDDGGYHANRTHTRVWHPDDPLAPADKKATIIEPAVYSGPTLVRTSFGLPPAFLGMQDLWDDDQLIFVQGAGSIDPTRSHFEQQKNTELGEVSATPNKTGLGWLGCYLADTPAVDDGSLRALAFSTFKIPSFNGGTGITPAFDPQTFDYPGGQALKDELQALYGSIPNPVSTGLDADIGAIQKLMGVSWGTAQGAYPASILGNQFRQAFEVIRDVPGIEVVTIDYDNIAGQRWDTHDDQGVFQGTMANLMNDLSTTMKAFMSDVVTLVGKTAIVLVYTEFGRTLHENGGKGTDHGRGGCSMILGEADRIHGRQVHTKPGVVWTDTPDDLPVHIDIRHLQAEAVEKCLGADPDAVFPDTSFDYDDQGLIV